MKMVIEEIRQHINNNSFNSEEQVKISIVLRLLHSLNWNTWNPNEVILEYKISEEDNTKVDLALLLSKYLPAIYIEVKKLNTINNKNICDVEKQLRNYNRDITAPITIITDGIKWYFYLSQTGGAFSSKKFKEINILKTNLEEIFETFELFLKREQFETGLAIQKASEYLTFNRKQLIINESLHFAKRRTDIPPFPSLVDTIIEILKEKGFKLTRNEAIEGIKKARNISDNFYTTNDQYIHANTEEIQRITRSIPRIIHTQRDLRWTEILNCSFDGRNLGRISWNSLLRVVLTKALSSNYSIDQLHSITGINLFENNPKRNGYNPIGFKNYYSLDVHATKAANNIELLSEKLNCKIYVKYVYAKGTQNGKIGELKFKY